MRKALLMLFVSFCIINFNADKKLTADVYHNYLNSEIDSTNVSMLNSENNILLGLNNYTNNFNLYEYNNVSFYDFKDFKRYYNYLYYNNVNNYYVKSIDDIRNSIYSGLNDGKDTIVLYCIYDDCLNDFYSIYENNSLMISINNYVSPYNMYSSIRYRISINNDSVVITLDINKKYTEEQIIEIEREIDNYFNMFDFSYMSDLEKIKFAHDYIVNKDKYVEDAASSAYSAYGAIVEDAAVCRGYAEAMAILLDRFDIPNLLISSGVHIWNLVYIDGQWLHLDVCWDDPIYSSGEDVIIYDYFLITSDELYNLDNSIIHKYNSDFYLESLIN